MEIKKIFKCFISSPDDCNQERQQCQKIIGEINEGLAKHLGIGLEAFMWENDVLPDMGTDGQSIIDKYVDKSNYDVFVGVMKNRFGHPTTKAGSGTEHEFLEAMRLKGSNLTEPTIMFFFGKENVDPDTFDADQYKKVKDFKQKLRNKGLYVDYEGIEGFCKKLKEKLELFIKEKSNLSDAEDIINEIQVITKRLQMELDEALKTYNESAPIWIEPIISSSKIIPQNPTKNFENKVEFDSIINTDKDIIIKAPSEFGLTSLAHYLKLEAYKKGRRFVYIDSKKTKKHKIVKDIHKYVESTFAKSANSIDCILIDSVCFGESGIMQLIKNACDEFKEIPIIIFNTLDDNFFLKSDEDDKIELGRDLTSYYLLPLPKTEVRKIVTSYSRKKSMVEDYNVILDKVTKDLEVLNMQRTPKNCIAILRACEKIGWDYNPINRTKLLETILNTIFEEYEIPTFYSDRPDVKDCTFVLGYFCEQLVNRNDFYFTEDYFKQSLNEFCNSRLINLDVKFLLDVLIDNSILSETYDKKLYFRNTYWVFYFIAHRMNMNEDFLKRIYENKKYIDYPEIIEFYTGIDRKKSDALSILMEDLDYTITEVKAKVNVPVSLNPYKSISWNPDIPELEREQNKLKANVISSGFPIEIKDKYDDKQYNQIRPYNQVINNVLREYSFLVLMRQISATSRALRNSDFVDVELRKSVLNKILEGWNEVNNLLIILHPLLADNGTVAIEGTRFELDEEDFAHFSDVHEKRAAVLYSLPTNVVKFFKDDLFSNKIGALLIDKAKNEQNSLLKHEIMLLIIAERPKNWQTIINDYIINLDKNSFFLSDVLVTLMYNRDFKATEVKDRQSLNALSEKCRTKHIHQKKNPDQGLIDRTRFDNNKM